jgi:hypothetical protein
MAGVLVRRSGSPAADLQTHPQEGDVSLAYLVNDEPREEPPA